MFTPKNIQGALEELYDLCDPDYMVDMLVNYTLQRMVDREAKRAEGKGVGYDRWAAKHNLKQMAATVTAYQQYGFSSPEELDEACSAAYAAMQESLAWLKQVEKTLNGKKELQRQVLAYSKTRPVRDGLKQQKNAKAYAESGKR